jgi:maltooligosyltrehalose trehalohydrolase
LAGGLVRAALERGGRLRAACRRLHARGAISTPPPRACRIWPISAITFVELMPVASFAGARGWGYDGVGLFAPHAAYGGPEGLKRFVDAAHAAGLGVLLDLVHNHFGPDGAYIHRIAPEFFTNRRKTPWGAAIDFAKPAVRSFFCRTPPTGSRNTASTVIATTPSTRSTAFPRIRRRPRRNRRSGAGRGARPPDPSLHEDDRNITDLHPWQNGAPRLYTAEWNDDFTLSPCRPCRRHRRDGRLLQRLRG